MPSVTGWEGVVAKAEDALQHHLLLLHQGAADLAVIDQLVIRGGRLLVARLVQLINAPKGKWDRLCAGQGQLIDPEPLMAALGLHQILELAGEINLQQGVILVMGKAQILVQVNAIVLSLMPPGNIVVHIVQRTFPGQISLFEIHSFTFLHTFFFLLQGQQPVVDPFVVWIPSQPAAGHAVFPCQQIHL